MALWLGAGQEYAYLLDKSRLQRYIEQGFKIYYLPAIRSTNLKEHGIDLAEYGAMILFTVEKHWELKRFN